MNSAPAQYLKTLDPLLEMEFQFSVAHEASGDIFSHISRGNRLNMRNFLLSMMSVKRSGVLSRIVTNADNIHLLVAEEYKQQQKEPFT